MSQTNLSLIIALCSVLSPLVVGCLNIWYNFKSKKLDYERDVTFKMYIHKRELFEKYLTLIGETAKHSKPSNQTDLINTYYSLLPYIPARDRKIFQKITFDFLNSKPVSTSLIFEVVDVINKELSNIPKK